MSGNEQVSDDDAEWRDWVRRVVAGIVLLGILIAAGGVWAYRRLEERRVFQERTAAAERLLAAGAQADFDGVKFTKILYGGRPADDEAFTILTGFTAARAVEAAGARVTNDGLRPLMELIKGVPLTEYCDEAKLAPRERSPHLLAG
jgi:hypothetical protein